MKNPGCDREKRTCLYYNHCVNYSICEESFRKFRSFFPSLKSLSCSGGNLLVAPSLISVPLITESLVFARLLQLLLHVPLLSLLLSPPHHYYDVCTRPSPRPTGQTQCLILAGVVYKWKGGQRPQRPSSLDPCRPHTFAWSAAGGTGGRITKRLILIDLH